MLHITHDISCAQNAILIHKFSTTKISLPWEPPPPPPPLKNPGYATDYRNVLREAVTTVYKYGSSFSQSGNLK